MSSKNEVIEKWCEMRIQDVLSHYNEYKRDKAIKENTIFEEVFMQSEPVAFFSVSPVVPCKDNHIDPKECFEVIPESPVLNITFTATDGQKISSAVRLAGISLYDFLGDILNTSNAVIETNN